MKFLHWSEFIIKMRLNLVSWKYDEIYSLEVIFDSSGRCHFSWCSFKYNTLEYKQVKHLRRMYGILETILSGKIKIALAEIALAGAWFGWILKIHWCSFWINIHWILHQNKTVFSRWKFLSEIPTPLSYVEHNIHF